MSNRQVRFERRVAARAARRERRHPPVIELPPARIPMPQAAEKRARGHKPRAKIKNEETDA